MLNKLLAFNSITKYELSKKSGVPFTSISELCAGIRSVNNISAQNLYKISRALDYDMRKLYESLVYNENVLAVLEIISEYLHNELGARNPKVKMLLEGFDDNIDLACEFKHVIELGNYDKNGIAVGPENVTAYALSQNKPKRKPFEIYGELLEIRKSHALRIKCKTPRQDFVK